MRVHVHPAEQQDSNLSQPTDDFCDGPKDMNSSPDVSIDMKMDQASEREGVINPKNQKEVNEIVAPTDDEWHLFAKESQGDLNRGKSTADAISRNVVNLILQKKLRKKVLRHKVNSAEWSKSVGGGVLRQCLLHFKKVII